MAIQESPLRDLAKIVEVGQNLTSFTDVDQLLAHIVDNIKDLCNCDEASILLMDKETNELFFRTVTGALGEVLHQVRLPIDDKSIAGWTVVNRKVQVVENCDKDPHFDRAVDQKTKFVTRNILAVPITWHGEPMGVAEALNKKNNCAFEEHDTVILQILAAHSAIALRQAFEVTDWHNYFMYSVELLTGALEAMDPIAHGHFDRVARIAGNLARKMGLSGPELEDIIQAAHFHDVGKIYTGHPITGMRDFEHPVKGAAVLEKIHMLRRIAPFVRHHHERWDGSGFPDRLEADQNPMGARIVALAEHFDEAWMTRDGEESSAGFNQRFLHEAAGRHDPTLLLALKEVLNAGHF